VEVLGGALWVLDQLDDLERDLGERRDVADLADRVLNDLVTLLDGDAHVYLPPAWGRFRAPG
jgi:hypothetical protein